MSQERNGVSGVDLKLELKNYDQTPSCPHCSSRYTAKHGRPYVAPKTTHHSEDDWGKLYFNPTFIFKI